MESLPKEELRTANARLLLAFRTHDQRGIGAFYYEQEKVFKPAIKRKFPELGDAYINDVFHESFVKLEHKININSINEENLDVPLGGYLYGIGVKIAQWYREKYKILPVGSDTTLIYVGDYEALPDIIDDVEFTEHDLVLIRHYVNNMGEPCASLLAKFYFDNSSMETIAQALRYKNADSAKTQKNKCMTKLRTIIKRHLYGYFDKE